LFSPDFETKRGYRPGQIMAVLTAVVPLLALLGHVTETRIFYGISSGPEMALHTAAAFLLIACGLLFNPHDPGFMTVLTGDSVGGVLARRLLLTAIGIAALLGSFRLIGERSGFYDREVAVSIMVLMLFGSFIWATSSFLTRADTERKLAQEALRESEQIYRAVVENVADGILINVGSTRRFANKAFLRMHGVQDLSEVIDKPSDQFVVAGEKSMVRERTLARQRGENVPAVYEYHIRRADGEVRTVQTAAVRITYQGRPAALAAVRDITERGRAEQRLRESEERFRAVVETAHQAIISADSDGNIADFNRAAERVFGYSAKGIVGQPLTALMPARFHAAHLEGFNHFRLTGESRLIGSTVELVGRRQDGTEFPLELSLAMWKAGDRSFVTGILNDITERKRREEEIIQLNESLNRRAIELEAVNKELETFSYSASHDLRAPLRSINGFSQALLEDCAAELSEEGKSHLQRICAATERMGQLIDDMLKMARLTRSELRMEPVDLSALAQRIAEELQKTEPQRRIDWVIAPGLAVEGDSGLLRAALENLLANAWKFTGKKESARIEFGLMDDTGKRVFFVRDDGAGFDMAYADKLFGVFQRLHDASEYAGTGIGLATVERIIRRHGGQVWGEGAVAEGATFYFTLANDTKGGADASGQDHSARGGQS
jgi:PAS domain S-box-containing protein